MPRLRAATAGLLLGTFVLYFATAKLGISLPVSKGIVSPVWAPAGIALVACFLFGRIALPVVFIGALLANATSGASVPLAAGIAAGNAAEGAFGAWILRRASFDPLLDRMRDLAALLVAAIASSILSATSGVSMLWLAGELRPGAGIERWTLWWFGDAMGVLVVAPVLFVVAARVRRGRRPTLARSVEFVVLILALAAVAFVVFSGDRWRFPALFLPLITLATLRFRALGSSVATLAITAIGLWHTIQGSIALENLTNTQSVQLLQLMLALLGFTMLALAAALSERDELNARLTESLAAQQHVAGELRRLDETKDRLLAAVSHELRTPLTSVLALANMLEDGHASIDTAKLGEMYAHLGREARRLDVLLSDLLDLERIRLGMFETTFQPVDLAMLVRRVADRHEAPDGRRATVDADHVRVDIAPALIERIVDNLLSNAFKHAPGDTPVVVRVRAVDGGALMVIDDEGEGVPEADRDTIYEPFNRGSSATSIAPGTGIGLSLVAQFTALHGGRTWVEDRFGGGASFRVFLPAARDSHGDAH